MALSPPIAVLSSKGRPVGLSDCRADHFVLMPFSAKSGNRQPRIKLLIHCKYCSQFFPCWSSQYLPLCCLSSAAELSDREILLNIRTSITLSDRFDVERHASSHGQLLPQAKAVVPLWSCGGARLC